jgi:hypothetical protein
VAAACAIKENKDRGHREGTMGTRYTGVGWAVPLALWLAGCTSPAEHAAAPPPAVPPYEEALYKSAIFEARNVHELKAIDPKQRSVQMVTWTKKDTAERYYTVGKTTLGIDVWVTLAPEVRELCRAYPRDPAGLTTRLQQLLGLPAAAEDRVFVTLEAKRRDIFRPCPDPDPGKRSCTGEFPAEVGVEHEAWMAEQFLARYREPDGYPWTHLGYTYDWAPGAGPVGATEFVIRKGAKVTVKEQTATEEYCRP